MKSFKFQLDTVLEYKAQVLDSLKIEHGQILAKVREQAEILETVRNQYTSFNREYTQKKEQGMTIADAMNYQNGLRVLEGYITRENNRLIELKDLEETKRAQVVSAKVDTSSIEKLRKIKQDLYNKAVLKEEESMLDELVASRRAVSNA